MRDHTVVADYLTHFCNGNIKGIESTLAEDLHFIGPFFEFKSRESYIQSLREDPPEVASHQILRVSEDDDSISVFYEYKKSHNSNMIAQYFRIKDNKIVETLLVFDRGSVV